MSLYHSSKYKLRNIQRTIESLLDGDFPLEAGRLALEKLQDVFSGFDKRLDLAEALGDPANLSQVTQNLNVKIYQALPILGFILRSTNVRNAFEMLEPLHAIAQAALQGKPQLILSSEWDYVPFAYPQSLDNLKSFILIGLPASEAASALLMPVAGHELGHAVWRNQGIGASLQQTLQSKCQAHYSSPNRMTEFRRHFSDYNEHDLVRKEILPDAISESASYAGYQAEELFSDLFAYACFGPSYLRAFAYILAPGEGASDAKYPTHSTRAAVIRHVAANETVAFPDFNALGFRPDGRRGDDRHQFIVRMAEAAVAEVTDQLWKIVLEIAARAPLVRPRAEQADLHLKNLQVGIPSPKVECVGNVINAGWQRYDEIVKTAHDPKELSDKLYQLNEILLKTIEVFEYQRRVA